MKTFTEFLAEATQRIVLEETFVEPDSHTKSDPGYLYHATNHENMHDIHASGKLDVHKPWEHTDQGAWPDGSTKKRNYFTPHAHAAWAFAPEHGQPRLLRVHAQQSGHPFKKEAHTGDVYSEKPLAAKHLEVLTHGGWKKLHDSLGEKSIHESSVATPPETLHSTAMHADDVQATHHHRKSFDDDHEAEITHYKWGSDAYNRPIRNGEEHDTDLLDHVTSQKTKHPMHVYRGVTHADHFDVRNLKAGDVVHDPGFSGTSLHPHIAGSFSHQEWNAGESKPTKHIMKVHVPAGSKGHMLDLKDHPMSVPDHMHEREFLLSRGSHFKFSHRTHGTDKHGNKYVVAHVDLHHQD